MGRYSSVQAYADNNSNMRAVTYEQATGSAEVKKGVTAVKAEKVSNPYGSTAGAGSGEFHVYRHARSREMERWDAIDRQEKQQQEEMEFANALRQADEEVLSKAEKNRRKRQRQKEAKLRKKNLELSGVATAATATVVVASEAGTKDGTTEEDEEFSYEPRKEKKGDTDEHDSKPPAIDIPNDGSFLERMKQQLAAAGTGTVEEKKGDNDQEETEPLRKKQAT